jgi:hypothetical protein
MHVYVPATPAVGRRKRIYQAGVFMGAGVVSIAWIFVILRVLPPTPTDRFATMAMLFSLFTPFAALWDDPGERRTRAQRLAEFSSCWFLLAGFAQTAWDLPWVLMDLAGTVRHIGPDDRWLWPWWAYGNADTRYLISDPTVVSVELCAGLAGPLLLLAGYLSRRGRRIEASWLALILGVGLAWGEIIWFLSEIHVGFVHVKGGAFGFWAKWFGMNLPWLLAPALYVPSSIAEIRELYEGRVGSTARIAQAPEEAAFIAAPSMAPPPSHPSRA